jgi:predicted RNA-binding Zn-ribbon protein involved in translation (DUF1610 family)
MSDKVFCGKCGEPIIGEAPDAKLPCPNCGSTSRVQNGAGDYFSFAFFVSG